MLTAFGGRRACSCTGPRPLSSTHNARFKAQRSLDGNSFATVATVPDQGTTLQPGSYSALDALAPLPALYYRLRQVDVDGAATFSLVVAVGPTAAPVSLFPNPDRDQLVSAGPAATASRILNALGQLQCHGTLRDSQATLELGTLPDGIHRLELSTAAGRVVRTFTQE